MHALQLLSLHRTAEDWQPTVTMCSSVDKKSKNSVSGVWDKVKEFRDFYTPVGAIMLC